MKSVIMKPEIILDFGFLIFDFKSKIQNPKSKIPSNGGQAMVEFTVAIVAVMAVIIGMLVLNRLEMAHTDTMLQARASAGALALSPLYALPDDASLVADWQRGADNARYTRDDEPLIDGTAIASAHTVALNAGPDGLAPLPTNAIMKLISAPTPLSEYYLVKGYGLIPVDLSSIPAVARLFSGEPVITVESKAYLAWTEGIY